MFAPNFFERLAVNCGGIIDHGQIALFSGAIFNVFVIGKTLTELIEVFIDNPVGDFHLRHLDIQPFIIGEAKLGRGNEFGIESERPIGLVRDVLRILDVKNLEVFVFFERFLKAVLDETGLHFLGNVFRVGLLDHGPRCFPWTEPGDAGLSYEGF